VVERFLPLFGGGDGDFEPFLDLGLAGEFGKQRRSQRQFQRRVRFVQGGDGTFRHRPPAWANSKSAARSKKGGANDFPLCPGSVDALAGLCVIYSPTFFPFYEVFRLNLLRGKTSIFYLQFAAQGCLWNKG